MVDLAVCGRVIMTSEIHRLAIEKYGVVSRWRKIYLMYDMFKTAWMSDAIVRAATDIFNKFILNTKEFDTPRNLYNVINEKYKEIYLVSHRVKEISKFREKISSLTRKIYMHHYNKISLFTYFR